jgi:hypothetical protein
MSFTDTESKQAPSKASFDKAFDEVVIILYKEYRKKKKAEQVKKLDDK